jgi:phosphomevalonate kinase
MGSSAALTSSLVGALLHFFGIVNLIGGGSAEDKKLVHNLSQIVHSVAQGKIGSGFDVSAAIYGSQFYTRFGTGLKLDDLANGNGIFEAVVCSHNVWDQTVEPFALPNGLDIVMGDVCGGSSSSLMVYTCTIVVACL